MNISLYSNLVVTVSILITEIINIEKQKSKKDNYKHRRGFSLANDYPKHVHDDVGGGGDGEWLTFLLRLNEQGNHCQVNSYGNGKYRKSPKETIQ